MSYFVSVDRACLFKRAQRSRTQLTSTTPMSDQETHDPQKTRPRPGHCATQPRSTLFANCTALREKKKTATLHGVLAAFISCPPPRQTHQHRRIPHRRGPARTSTPWWRERHTSASTSTGSSTDTGTGTSTSRVFGSRILLSTRLTSTFGFQAPLFAPRHAYLDGKPRRRVGRWDRAGDSLSKRCSVFRRRWQELEEERAGSAGGGSEPRAAMKKYELEAVVPRPVRADGTTRPDEWVCMCSAANFLDSGTCRRCGPGPSPAQRAAVAGEYQRVRHRPGAGRSVARQSRDRLRRSSRTKCLPRKGRRRSRPWDGQ